MSSAARPIVLGKIGYLNVLPIYEPLEAGRVPHRFVIRSGPPSTLNELMRRGELDLSACSSIEYARNPADYLLVPDLAIGSRGPVQSVQLLSRVPLARLDGERVLISSHTHTSAALLMLLLKKVVGVKPLYTTGEVTGVAGEDEPPAAMLAIGDEALALRDDPAFPYRWDLGQAWTEMTGLPFIFGLWVVRRRSAMELGMGMERAVAALAAAKADGLSRLTHLSAMAARRMEWEHEAMHDYFRGLCYGLGEWEMQGLARFYAWLAEEELIDAAPELKFFTPLCTAD